MAGEYPAPGLPAFCLERWQSLHETRARILLSESGVEPPPWSLLDSLGAGPSIVAEEDLGYGWTKGDPRLREAIAENVYSGIVDGERVIVTNGSAEANLITVLALVGPGDLVLVDSPNYMQFHGLLEMRGARVFEVWRRPGDWSLPLDQLVEAVDEYRPKAVFITNPNNPTGNITRRLEDLLSVARRARTILVFDEVYRGLELDGETTPSVIEVASAEGVDAVSTGGLSKAYGLPGLRIGWAASTGKSIIDRLWAVKDYTTIAPSRPSQAIARRILSGGASRVLLERARRIVARNLALFEEALAGYEGVLEIWTPSAGAFVLARLPWSRDSVNIASVLMERYGILVNPGECFGLPGTLRIGLGHSDPAEARESYHALLRALVSVRDESSRAS